MLGLKLTHVSKGGTGLCGLKSIPIVNAVCSFVEEYHNLQAIIFHVADRYLVHLMVVA